MTDSNPWLVGPTNPAEPAPTPPPPVTRREVRLGPVAPQPGVPTPDIADRLPQTVAHWPATVWWLGVHGGAGETTLAALAGGTRSAGHAWPMPTTPGRPSRVVLVARTNYSGLTAAQRAATEWASNALGDAVQVAGLVLMPDAPGKRPRPLRDLEQVVAGGVPRVWTMPWVEAWRIAPARPGDAPPKEFRALFSDLSLTSSNPALS